MGRDAVRQSFGFWCGERLIHAPVVVGSLHQNARTCSMQQLGVVSFASGGSTVAVYRGILKERQGRPEWSLTGLLFLVVSDNNLDSGASPPLRTRVVDIQN